MNVLDDLQRDVEVKDRLLQQSLVALTDLVSGREHVFSSPEQVLQTFRVKVLEMK